MARRCMGWEGRGPALQKPRPQARHPRLGRRRCAGVTSAGGRRGTPPSARAQKSKLCSPGAAARAPRPCPGGVTAQVGRRGAGGGVSGLGPWSPSAGGALSQCEQRGAGPLPGRGNEPTWLHWGRGIVLAFVPGPAPHGHNVAAVAPSFSFSENTTPGQEERTVLCLLLRGRKPSPGVPQQTVLHASISIPVVTGQLL